MEDGKHNSAVVTKCLHNYNASILADAACEKAGTREYTCTICGNSYMEEIPATGHTVEIDPEVQLLVKPPVLRKEAIAVSAEKYWLSRLSSQPQDIHRLQMTR